VGGVAAARAYNPCMLHSLNSLFGTAVMVVR